MKKLITLMLALCMLLVLSACGAKTGYVDKLAEVETAEPAEETENWVLESINYQDANQSVKKLFKSSKVDSLPKMYLGYQINHDGVYYSFLTVDKENVEHLVLLKQNVDETVELVKDTTDFDLLEYLTN